MAVPSQTSDQQTSKTDEQPKGQAGDEGTGVAEEETTEEATEEEGEEGEGDESEGDEEGEEEESEGEALSEDEMKALSPEMRKAVTRKFQQLSAERKELRPWRNLINALNEDPKAATIALAKQLGVDVVMPKSPTEETAEDISTKILKAVKGKLGPEYEDLAGTLAPAIQEAADILVEERLKTTNDELSEIKADTALNEANRAINIVSKRYPDFKKHEKAITALSQRMPPGKGMDQVEYLENLYYLATREVSQGEAAKRTIKRVAKSAGNAERRSSTVDSKSVALAPGKVPTFAEAAAAAKRGEVFE